MAISPEGGARPGREDASVEAGSGATEVSLPENSAVVLDQLEMAEGPVCLPDGSVLVCEILGGRLRHVAVDGGQTVIDTGGGPNGAALGPGGQIFVANNGGLVSRSVGGRQLLTLGDFPHPPGSIQTINLSTREVTTLITHASGQPLIAPNDLVFDRDGGFWFTDHGSVNSEGTELGSLCWARPDGSEARAVDTRLAAPNGVVVSPDGRTVYVSLTWERCILAYRITGPGEVELRADGRADARVLAKLDGPFAFDSMGMEENGNIVVATIQEGSLIVIAPDGRIVERVPLPGWVTNVDFGGPDRRSAYITFMRAEEVIDVDGPVGMAMPGTLLRCEWPRPGLRLPYP